jgi:hypothetical protein
MCEEKGMNNRITETKIWLFGWMNKRRGREQSPSSLVFNIVAYFMNKNKQTQEITLNILSLKIIVNQRNRYVDFSSLSDEILKIHELLIRFVHQISKDMREDIKKI